MIRRPFAILALLTGLNLLNYIDRLVLSAVLPRVQEELGLSNFVGGLLATVFLVGYMLTSPIFGALGDRMRRVSLIAGGILVWSLATVGSGLARTAWALVFARAFVGVGEAAYATLAPTIIDDTTEPSRKGRSLAVFYAATPVGAALGYLIGGFVEKNWGWRSAFFVAGGPGVLLALVCLLVAEPARKERADKPHLLHDLQKLLSKRHYVQGVLGYCAHTAAVGAFGYWAPKFLYTRYAMPLASANFVFGIVLVVGGLIGTLVGGSWADRGAARAGGDGSSPSALNAQLKVCAIGTFAAAPLTALAFFAPSSTLFFAFAFVAILGIFLGTSPINAVILRAVPESLRASAMALSILSIHVLGDLWSPAAVGLAADHMPMHLAMMVLPLAFAVSTWVWWPRRATVAASPEPAS